jgi:hypothetical protein
MTSGAVTLSSTTPGIQEGLFIGALTPDGLPSSWSIYLNSPAEWGWDLGYGMISEYIYHTYDELTYESLTMASWAWHDGPAGDWTTVPEPATLLLLGFGMAGLAGAGIKFRK